jgi:eukaryotic-like serine/threonine-protein kinase
VTPRYHFERVIGRGRHASLWLATDNERDETVVLKIAPRGSLQREFDTLRAIAGEHVVTAHDCGVLPDGRPFIAMAYLGRGDVAHVHLPEALLDRIVHDAAFALAAVHRAGWVHRDIKPAHLLLRGDAQVALCDFGSAARIGERGEQKTPCVIGTPRYAAPEQIEGAPAAPAADVYSFGVCLYELLARRPPFRGETLTELFSQHLRAPVPRLPREAAHWQALVDALLAKDPARRPADGDALLARLSVLMGEVM